MRLAVFSVLFVTSAALSGCTSSSVQTSNSPRTATSEREPWFCQTGIDAEQWECIQSETLARSPEPTRSPPRPAPPPEPRPFSSPDTPIASASVRGAESDSGEVFDPAAMERPAQAANATDERPKHVRLSYKPDRPVSILELPADFWAVQLVALSSPEALETYVARHKMRGMSAARIYNGQQMYYVLLLGIYETRVLAEEAITDLPAPFNLHTPWIRSLGSLQRAMVLADEVGGDAVDVDQADNTSG